MKFYKKTVRDVPLDGRVVLIRADYNVPLLDDGTIADDYRITQSIPTLQYLIERGCKLVICAHLGRPDGQAKPELSLEPIAGHLSELLGREVLFSPDCVGDGVVQIVKRLAPGGIVLLENLRFHPEEEKNDEGFARRLAADSQAEYFIQDGFGVVHRAHASTEGVTHFLPSVAGLLIEREFTAITGAMDDPKKPLVAILGGAKVSDKIGIIKRLVGVADTILVGGAMANTFLSYKGCNVGKSVCEPDMKATLDEIYASASQKLGDNADVDDFILLPTDVAVATEINKDQRRQVVGVADVREDELILDIGPATIEQYVASLKVAGTAIWNGTMGYAELDQFAIGSARIALQLAQAKAATTSIIGGGDTADFVLKWDGEGGGSSFTHVSTGGGASLELMAGDKLPGIEALMNA